MIHPPLAFAMWGLTPVDLAAIVGYFAAMIWIGYRAMRRIRNQEDYFLAGRKFGKLIQTFAAFGQATSADNAVGSTTMVATNGAAGIWANLSWGVFTMPIFWMTSVWYRRLRLLTLADFFEERYNSRAMAGFYALLQAIFFMLVAGLGFSAMTKTVAAIAAKPVAEFTVAERAEYDKAVELGALETQDYACLTAPQQERLKELRRENPRKEFSYVNNTLLVCAMALVVLFYAVAGGLEAAFLTDLVQGCFILVLSVLLLPFAMMKINALHGEAGVLGPMRAMHRLLPESLFELWGSPGIPEFTWYWIAAFAAVSVINVAVQANQLTSTGSAKDDHTARYGFVAGILLKRYATVMWGLLALLTLVLYGGTVKDPDLVWGTATRDLLGPLGIGLVGLMVACLMAALMSTLDCHMLTTAALLTRNVYRPLAPGRSDRHYLGVGRLLGTVYLAGGVLIALAFTSVFDLMKFVQLFNCILAASFWLGMVWRRSNRAAAWASMVVTFGLTFLLPLLIPLAPGVRTNPYLMKATDSAVVRRTYTAHAMDVTDRAAAIARWDAAAACGAATGARPAPLAAGEKFEKTFATPSRAIFWVNGFQTEGGVRQGSGLLKVELVALDLVGWDLAKNSYAFNETVAMIIRLVLPFGSLILVALLTRPEAKDRLDRFYVKMKTPTLADRDADAREMERSYADPHRFDHLKVFPRSNWEFRRWNREDLRGLIGTSIAAAGIVVLLYLMVTIGR